MNTNRFDIFLQHWGAAFHAVQACTIAAWPVPEVRKACELAKDCLTCSLDLVEEIALQNLDRYGFHDIAAPDPPVTLSPIIRDVIALKIDRIVTSLTRQELLERLEAETRTGVGLMGPDGVTAHFLSQVFGQAAGDCGLVGEKPTVRKARCVPRDTATLFVLELIESEQGDGGCHEG